MTRYLQQLRFSLAVLSVLGLLSIGTVACSVGSNNDSDTTPTATTAPAQTTTTGQALSGAAVASPSATSTTSAKESPTATASPTARTSASPVADSGKNLVTAVQDVVHQVEPSVVYIAVTDQTTDSFGQTQEQQGVGSGVIFDNQGHILTNNHVVEGADTMTVILPDGRKFQASVVGRSPAHDIAVIKIDADNLPVATLGDSSKLDVGQWVVAIGNPLALSQDSPTVTVGVVSALGRTIGAQGEDAGIANLIQTDAAINPGNSGGPLLNLDGQVVGINTAKIQQAEGIGFAIPINDAKQIIDQALNGNAQASLGISGATVTPAIAARFDLPVTSGVIVADVEADSAAEAAGLQPGDVIVKLDDQAIATIDDLQTAITSHQPGDQVTLTVNRNGTEQQMPVTLGKSVVLQ